MGFELGFYYFVNKMYVYVRVRKIESFCVVDYRKGVNGRHQYRPRRQRQLWHGESPAVTTLVDGKSEEGRR